MKSSHDYLRNNIFNNLTNEELDIFSKDIFESYDESEKITVKIDEEVIGK